MIKELEKHKICRLKTEYAFKKLKQVAENQNFQGEVSEEAWKAYDTFQEALEIQEKCRIKILSSLSMN